MKDKIQLTDPDVRAVYELFNTELKGTIFEGFDEIIKVNNRFISSFKNRFEKVSFVQNEDPGDDIFEALQLHLKRKKELENLIEKHKEPAKNISLNLFFSSYFDSYSSFSAKLQNKLIRKEKEEKYALTSHGNPLLLIRKLLSNTKLSTIYTAHSFVNFVRKIFRKSPIDYTKYRKRRIPYRQMIKFYLIPQLLQKTIANIPVIMEGRNASLLKLWDTDQQLEDWFYAQLNQPYGENTNNADKENISPPPTIDVFPELKTLNSELKKKTHEAIEHSIDEVFMAFDKAIQMVGTIDLSASIYQAREVNQQTIDIDHKLADELMLWDNSTNTLFDDWCMDIEITTLYYSEVDEYFKLKNKLSDFISNNLSVNFKQLADYINNSNQRLAGANTSVRAARAALIEERETLNIELVDKILTKTIEKLSGNFIEDFDRLKKKTFSLVENISDKRGFSKNQNYTRGIKNSEIKTISPRELLNFEALPHLEQKLEEIKVFIKGHLEKARLNLLSLGTVSDFNLESAVLLLDEKRNAAKKAIELASEGYERALNHLDTSIDLIEEIKSEPLDKLKEALNAFNVEIQSLKNTDNILELNLRIAKIKAVERSKKARQDALNTTKVLVRKGGYLIKKNYKVLEAEVNKIKSRIGMHAHKTEISFELSEIIRESKSYIKKLPFVYQRLYKLRPTDEDRFFANRNAEIDILMEAYEDWQKDRFVSVAILGEKGSGITSYINKFIRDIETETTIIRDTLDKKIVTLEEYLVYFSKLFEVGQFENNEDIIKYINESEGYKIIFLENMHHFFLKKVGGFESLKLFFDLMANTSRKTLWISAYTRHSWEYLDQALHISDYYIRKIELLKMTDKTIEEIIFSRNLLSGYKIIFEAAKINMEDKAFTKMNEGEKQGFLRKKFFSDLNKTCNGNISLALLFWLRSTSDVSEESITIANLPEIDLSFVKAFSSDYMFTLHAILIHDGLSLEDYSTIFNTSVHLARNTLIPMLEKGLLIRPKEKFNINPVIFKQVTQLLSSKNFIN